MATTGKDWCSTAFYSSFPLHCQRPTSSRVQHVQHQMHTYAHKHHAEPVQLMMSSALGEAHASSAHVRLHPTIREVERTSLETMEGKRQDRTEERIKRLGQDRQIMARGQIRVTYYNLSQDMYNLNSCRITVSHF